MQKWQPHLEALKSFDPATGRTTLLDQSQADGVNEFNYAYQTFSAEYITGDQVLYTKSWAGRGFVGGVPDTSKGILNGKQVSLEGIGADGSGHKTLKTLSYPTMTYSLSEVTMFLNSRMFEPNSLYLLFNDNAKDNFYVYQGGKVVSDSDLTTDTFYGNSSYAYLPSPSGSNTLWVEQRDGKNAFFVGDQNAKNEKQVANLSSYNPYAWFTDDYLVVSKGNNELYILPVTGGTPQKITDYYGSGYGYGYGEF